MKVLLTNDDGIDAPGLQALFEAASQFGEPMVVAPAAALSGCSHRVTTDRPLRYIPRQAGRYAVEGTPADCVRLARHQLAPDTAWVLSGINSGGNLGADVYHSGTVAAVREAVLHGWPGVALSQYRRRGLETDWHQAAAWVVRVLRQVLGQPWTPGTFWNVNLPHLEPGSAEPEIVFCPLDPGPLPLSFREQDGQFHYDGNYHQRSRTPGSDVEVCFSGRIAITRLTLF
jgi:5'-nucleotidase